jgi:hypothetical protein
MEFESMVVQSQELLKVALETEDALAYLASLV